MSITSVNQVSSKIMPAKQTKQDSHEKNIQKKIANLQEKVKSIAYDREKTNEEKTNEKKKLEEQIQSLNNELMQYQTQKQQKEAAKQKEPVDTRNAVQIRDTAETKTSVSAREQSVSEHKSKEQTDKEQTGFRDGEEGVIISISNTKEQVTRMKKIRTDLEGRMLTAETEQEKQKLQERINHVSMNMGEKFQKIAETIADNQKSEQERKDKVGEVLRKQEEEREARKKAINVVLPNSGNKTVSNVRGQENFMLSGKVSI